MVVAVDLADSPAEGRPLLGERLEADRPLGRVPLLEAVPINDRDEVVEAGVTGRHRGLDGWLDALAVAIAP